MKHYAAPFGENRWRRHTLLWGKSRNNRREITGLMERHGFIAYPYEFWHYSSGDAYAEFRTGSNQEARYGSINWIKKTGKIISLKNTREPLHKSEAIMKKPNTP